MFNRLFVQDALRKSRILDESTMVMNTKKFKNGLDRELSLLIHDIFGGEILKTHARKGWHFYNKIDGERIDFTSVDTGKATEEYSFEDIPSTRDETNKDFEQVDYSTLFMRFVRAFEETVGLDKYYMNIMPESTAYRVTMENPM
jgi:hypothetical protein